MQAANSMPYMKASLTANLRVPEAGIILLWAKSAAKQVK